MRTAMKGRVLALTTSSYYCLLLLTYYYCLRLPLRHVGQPPSAGTSLSRTQHRRRLESVEGFEERGEWDALDQDLR
jgi:hypothetical protein